MIAEISAGLSGLKAAMDITKGLNAAKGEAAINEVKIDLQRNIIEALGSLTAAHEAQTANLKRIDELEAQVVGMKDWEREKQRYQMKRFTPGSVAYCLKPEMADGEPPHRICPHCYHEGKKGFLQSTGDRHGRGTLHSCTSCQSKTVLGQELSDASPSEPPEPTPPPERPYDRYAELREE